MQPCAPTHAAARWANEIVHLLPECALWWPARHTLFIADLHLGKAASFRAAGVPVPAGSTHDNFQRLSALIERHAAKRLVFLGDFTHAASGWNSGVQARLLRWRHRHAATSMTLVRGNHDAHAGDPPPGVDIDVVDAPFLIGPFAASHHPVPHHTHFVLAGHMHPMVVLTGSGRDRLRLACFLHEDRFAVLPAFGAFTGGQQVRPGMRRTIHAIGANRVWLVPGNIEPSDEASQSPSTD